MSGSPPQPNGAETVALTFTTKQIADRVPDVTRPANWTVGQLQQWLFSKLRRNNQGMTVVHVFIMLGSEGFIPTPDQTLGNLSMLFAHDDISEKGKKVLSLCISPNIFQG